ncbi:DUF4438 domain-containing protein [bacterium]|nr:DUF4438 domain-containing protein [bacterium]
MPKLKTNRSELIIQSVIGEISSPLSNPMNPYRISADGEPMVLPGIGGITFNKRIGDSAVDLWGDHVEPAVSMKNTDKTVGSPANGALNVMSCIGNRAQVVSGDAKDEWGRVTGTHGGIEHVLVDFTFEQMEKMVIGDRIQVRSTGQGLKLLDFPDIKVMNLDPDLLDLMGITGTKKSGRLSIPVTHTIPAMVMGSGLGKVSTHAGDYDIQMFDEETVEKHSLNTLRFGDIVAITDADHSFGRIYRAKSISVGVIVHSRSVLSGHGPGVTTLFTSTKGYIDAVINADANLVNYFKELD